MEIKGNFSCHTSHIAEQIFFGSMFLQNPANRLDKPRSGSCISPGVKSGNGAIREKAKYLIAWGLILDPVHASCFFYLEQTGSICLRHVILTYKRLRNRHEKVFCKTWHWNRFLCMPLSSNAYQHLIDLLGKPGILNINIMLIFKKNW